MTWKPSGTRRAESREAAFGRLRASLAAARALRDGGCAFVVAPVPALDGEPLVRADHQFSVALYPFVHGQSFAWGQFTGPAHRRGLLDLILGVHTAPGAASGWPRPMISPSRYGTSWKQPSAPLPSVAALRR